MRAVCFFCFTSCCTWAEALPDYFRVTPYLELREEKAFYSLQDRLFWPVTTVIKERAKRSILGLSAVQLFCCVFWGIFRGKRPDSWSLTSLTIHQQKKLLTPSAITFSGLRRDIHQDNCPWLHSRGLAVFSFALSVNVACSIQRETEPGSSKCPWGFLIKALRDAGRVWACLHPFQRADCL